MSAIEHAEAMSDARITLVLLERAAEVLSCSDMHDHSDRFQRKVDRWVKEIQAEQQTQLRRYDKACAALTAKDTP